MGGLDMKYVASAVAIVAATVALSTVAIAQDKPTIAFVVNGPSDFWKLTEAGVATAQTELPDEAKAALDQMITQLKADPKGAWFEIEGHTDNVGAPTINERIGLERAEAVKRYLYEQHNIPLHKMNVISYGEEKPIAPNRTRDGRAQNRRVVIKVLA